MGGASRKPTSAPATTVKLVATLKADWPVTSAGDERLANTWSLVEKLKAADIGAKGSLTPEQQEELEEQQAMIAQMGMSEEGSAAADPSAPKFTYVAKLSDDEQSKLTAEAFARAKTQAARLAKAAGAELGPIKQLNGQAITSTPGQENAYVYYQWQMMNAQGAGAATDAAPDETIGADPARVQLRITVSASFALK